MIILFWLRNFIIHFHLNHYYYRTYQHRLFIGNELGFLQVISMSSLGIESVCIWNNNFYRRTQSINIHPTNCISFISPPHKRKRSKCYDWGRRPNMLCSIRIYTHTRRTLFCVWRIDFDIISSRHWAHFMFCKYNFNLILRE